MVLYTLGSNGGMRVSNPVCGCDRERGALGSASVAKADCGGPDGAIEVEIVAIAVARRWVGCRGGFECVRYRYRSTATSCEFLELVCG